MSRNEMDCTILLIDVFHGAVTKYEAYEYFGSPDHPTGCGVHCVHWCPVSLVCCTPLTVTH